MYYKVGCRIIRAGASEVSERELVEQTDHDVAALLQFLFILSICLVSVVMVYIRSLVQILGNGTNWICKKMSSNS